MAPPPDAWYMDEKDEVDQREPHRLVPNEPVSGETLRALGVVYWKLDADSHEDDPELEEIRKARGYNYQDIITVSKDKLPGYEEKIKIFFEEHIHEDEEIRYVLDGRCARLPRARTWRRAAPAAPAGTQVRGARVGPLTRRGAAAALPAPARAPRPGARSGYFDVRDADDRWIRIDCRKGDMIVLPEGMYHRFTLDTGNYIKAMRLFVGDPVWTPFNRPQEENASRKKYVEEFLGAARAGITAA